MFEEQWYPLERVHSPWLRQLTSQLKRPHRAGEKTLYVQARNSPVYRLELAEPCDALYAAQKLSVRASGYELCIFPNDCVKKSKK